jgi:hypothetical protein
VVEAAQTVLHFTPTSSSWLNQVERWFRDLTEKNLRRGVLGSVPDLIASIEAYSAPITPIPDLTWSRSPGGPAEIFWPLFLNGAQACERPGEALACSL